MNEKSCESCKYRTSDTICSLWDDLIYTWCFMYTPKEVIE